MPEKIKVSSMHAWKSFGRGESSAIEDKRFFRRAIKAVQAIDADVISIAELMWIGGYKDEDYETERLEEIITSMGILGYKGCIENTYRYSMPNNDRPSYNSIWSRIGEVEQSPLDLGERNGLVVRVPDANLSIYTFHLSDQSPQSRVHSAELLKEHISLRTDSSVVMGPFNNMYPNLFTSRFARFTGYLASKIKVEDYYDEDKKIQRFAGKIQRIGLMADGGALNVFEHAGFLDADPDFRPTTGKWPFAYQMSHILGSAGVVFDDYGIYRKGNNADGSKLFRTLPIFANVITD